MSIETPEALKAWDLSPEEMASVREVMIDGGAWQLIELTSDTSDRSPSPETVLAARDDIRSMLAEQEVAVRADELRKAIEELDGHGLIHSARDSDYWEGWDDSNKKAREVLTLRIARTQAVTS